MDVSLVSAGWLAHSEFGVFDPHVTTLFDFRIQCREVASFVRVLPNGPHEAFVEYLSLAPPGWFADPAIQREALAGYLGGVLGAKRYWLLAEERASRPLIRAGTLLGEVAGPWPSGREPG